MRGGAEGTRSRGGKIPHCGGDAERASRGDTISCHGKKEGGAEGTRSGKGKSLVAAAPPSKRSGAEGTRSGEGKNPFSAALPSRGLQ